MSADDNGHSALLKERLKELQANRQAILARCNELMAKETLSDDASASPQLLAANEELARIDALILECERQAGVHTVPQSTAKH